MPRGRPRGGARPSPFLARKLKKGFDCLDTDGNHLLELADFRAAADRTTLAYGKHPDSVDGSRLRETWETMWQKVFAPIDRDGDGSVTFEEFSFALGEGLTDDPEAFDRWIAPCVDAIVDIGDSDRDGRLSKHEFASAYRAMFNLTEEATREAFTHLDADGDGSITRSELQTAVAQYWGGDDETANGNWLLGPL